MKKGFLAVLLLGMTGLCAFAQTMTLDAAITSAADEIGGRLDRKTKIAVLNISSSSKAMAEYVIDELSSALINDGRLLVVERDQEKLGLARQELDFNDSDEVSNKSAQQIGRMLGAQSIINGSMKVVEGAYRLTIEVLEVETSIKRYSKNFSVQNNQLVKSLMGGTGSTAALLDDFTSSERAGTAAFNLLFGMGSFKQQQDRLGGTITAVAEGLGLLGVVAGALMTGSSYSSSNEGYSEQSSDYTGLVVFGAILYGGGAIFGAIRAFTFHKPGSVVTMTKPWDLDLVADHKGNAGLRVSYTLKY